ncbi:fibronectin type III domain-containing protein [Nonomuraea recticatena]|uniref:Fibronectin type-III domain-containing protein n=1 Tax=Nonomuraea recticatena TaxID=46178 RepID=A0ABN3T5B7_9ACTN
MGVIHQAYTFGHSSSTTTSLTFPAVQAGHRIVVMVAAFNTPSMLTSGYVRHAAADGYDHAHIYSRVATGGETRVDVSVSAGGDGVILFLQVRDDCRDVLFATSGNADSAATTISCDPVNVPAGVGAVFGVFERTGTGAVTPNRWTPAMTENTASPGGFSSTQNTAQFYISPMPPPGMTTITNEMNGAGRAQAAFVGFGVTDVVAPTSPPNLRATNVTDTAVTIAWDAASDDKAVTGYGLYLDGAKKGGDQSALTYTFTGLTKGQTYALSVDARDAAGNRSAKSTISVLAVTDTTPPTTPANLRVAALAHTSATIVWEPSLDDVGLSGYGIYLNGAKKGGDQPDLEHTFTGLARGSSHTAGVDAVDASGNRSPIAAVDFVTLADTLPSAPPGLTATPGVDQITLAWQAATDDLGIARYEILLDGEVTAATSTLGHVIEGLDPASFYQVGVRAVDDGGGRGPLAETEAFTLSADWVPLATPVYRLEGWTGNARDAHGVDWVVEREEGWSSSADVLALDAESDSSDGGFSGPGTYGGRLITLEGTAVAASRREMLAAQERMTSVLYPRQLGTLRVQERERTRQARVRLDSAVEIVDRGSVAFGWVLTVKAPDPRRTAVRPIYREVAVPVLPGSASGEVFLAGDYPWIPARIQVWGPIKDFTITHEQTGLVIRSKPGVSLPADSRYSLDIDLATRQVWAFVPPDVWPEPRPGRGMLGSFPARFALQNGPNTIVLAGQPVAGQTGTPRMVVQAWDAWR